MISFVGAGPGAADLLTLRAVHRLRQADLVLWAGSLVSPEVLQHCQDAAEVFDTKAMTLEQVTDIYAAHPDAAIVRLHSGDPACFSAVGEQVAWCLDRGRDFEIVPGVAAIGAAAAAAGLELTVPGVSQSVVMTRLARRTRAGMGPGDDLVAYAAHGSLMVLFLSAGDPEGVQRVLLSPPSAYTEDTPTLIAYRVSWPDEQIVFTRLGNLPHELTQRSIATSALILVGDALGSDRPRRRSHVYDPGYAHRYRPA